MFKILKQHSKAVELLM